MSQFKVLHVTLGPMNVGGTEMVIMNYIRNCNRMLFSPYVAILDYCERSQGINEKELEKLGVKVIHFGEYRFRYFYKSFLPIKQYLKKELFDIIHIHISPGVEHPLQRVILHYAEKMNIPCTIIHSHAVKINFSIKYALPFLIYKNITNLFYKYTYKMAFACSPLAGKSLVGENKPFKMIKNGINIKDFSFSTKSRQSIRKFYNIADESIVLGHIGAFTINKNQSFIVDLLKKLIEEDTTHTHYTLLLIGDGANKRHIEQKVKNLQLDNNVIFTGIRMDTQCFLSAMDLFIMPSEQEGLGLVLIEAQCSGLPCITSTGIPIEAKCIDHFSQFSLLDNLNLWENEVIKFSQLKYNREDCAESLKISGWDISDIVKEIENNYLSFLK